jgi:two-component system cell cycle response regulator
LLQSVDLHREITLENDLNTDLIVLQSHLESMLDRAKINSAYLRKFQAFEMRLLKLNSLSDMVEHLLDDAKDYFDIDMIGLCLVDEKDEIAAILNEAGYDCRSKKGLVLVDSKSKRVSAFGIMSRPYIGAFNNVKYGDYFSDVEKKPASIAVTPLTRRDAILGSLSLGSYQVDRFADTMATDFVEHLASIVGICLENNLNFETIKRTSFVDGLTGINNRRFFEQRIGEEVDRCRRNLDPISCLFLDIDFFKVVNDKLGHQVGDKVLCEVANAIKAQLRSNDVLARYGGEEFVVLLSNIDEVMVLEIAERILKTIRSLTVILDGSSISVTVSIGVSTYLPAPSSIPSECDIPSMLVNIADAALYKAKRGGRNRVENGGVISEKSGIDKVSVAKI